MLSTKTCAGCRQDFLDWEDHSFDDIIAGPYCSLSGDLMCTRCGPQSDARAEDAEDAESEAYEDIWLDEV
jgi:DNA-directed RNA polymerase subunit RPC12/RpoP